MPLTRKTDGTGAANLVTASWFNDFYDLLTGAMTDQAVTVANTLSGKGYFAHTFLTTSDDSISLFDRNGVKGTQVGWAQNGGGFYLWDNVNGAYIITNSTSNGITLQAHTSAATGLWVKPQGQYGTAFPTIALGIGDNDTGLDWDSDGEISVWNNNVKKTTFKADGTISVNYGSTSGYLGMMCTAGGGASGIRVWIGTTDPLGAAAEGDLWAGA